jgi:hypothetical protein
MAGAPRKLSVIRENWRRQANGRLRVWSPAQRRLWGKLATDRFWPVPEIGVNSQLQSMAGFDGFTSDRFVAVSKLRAPGHVVT